MPRVFESGRVVSLVLFAALVLGGCSRERVESVTQMNAGIQLAIQKRYTEAAEALERAAAIDRTNDQALFTLAQVHVESRNFERAKDALNRAIAVAPDKASYHEKLGTVLIQLEDWAAARTAFEKAIELDPNLFKAYFKLGQVMEHQSDYQGALQKYSEAIQHGPRFIEAYVELGRLYGDLGRVYSDPTFVAHSTQVLEAGLAVSIQGTEEEAKLHHLLGVSFQDQRNYTQAIEHFRKALEIVPGMPDALMSLGWTYALTDNREEARRYLRKYIEVATDAPPAYLKAARDRLAELEVN